MTTRHGSLLDELDGPEDPDEWEEAVYGSIG